MKRPDAWASSELPARLQHRGHSVLPLVSVPEMSYEFGDTLLNVLTDA